MNKVIGSFAATLREGLQRGPRHRQRQCWSLAHSPKDPANRVAQASSQASEASAAVGLRELQGVHTIGPQDLSTSHHEETEL